MQRNLNAVGTREDEMMWRGACGDDGIQLTGAFGANAGVVREDEFPPFSKSALRPPRPPGSLHDDDDSLQQTVITVPGMNSLTSSTSNPAYSRRLSQSYLVAG